MIITFLVGGAQHFLEWSTGKLNRGAGISPRLIRGGVRGASQLATCSGGVPGASAGIGGVPGARRMLRRMLGGVRGTFWLWSLCVVLSSYWLER